MPKTSHDPQECKDALLWARDHQIPAFIDIEGTGVHWRDYLVSIGIRIDGRVFILFYKTGDSQTAKHLITFDQLRDALSPLLENSLVAVLHHATYDLTKIQQMGIPVHCVIHDTEKLLRLHDQDRGRDSGEGGTHYRRKSLRTGKYLNHKLKPSLDDILCIKAVEFPHESMLDIAYHKHVEYLRSDLLATELLYSHLVQNISNSKADYYCRAVAPFVHRWVGMSLQGVCTSKEFLSQELERVRKSMFDLSGEHFREFGQALHVNNSFVQNWIYGAKGLSMPRQGKERSLKREILEAFANKANPKSKQSLLMIRDYFVLKQLQSVFGRKGLSKVFTDSGIDRFHPGVDVTQRSGRVSVQGPALQNIPKKMELLHMTNLLFKTRDSIKASPGCTLVSFDISGADIRSLVQLCEMQKETEYDLYHRSLITRMDDPNRDMLWNECKKHRIQKTNYGPSKGFDPKMKSQMLEDLKLPDFYQQVSQRVFGTTASKSKAKTLVLSFINGVGNKNLSEDLGVSESAIAGIKDQFALAYPKETAFLKLLTLQAALFGVTHTYNGLPRDDKVHQWLIDEPVVDFTMEYATNEKLQLRVQPIKPGLRTFTFKVLRVTDVQYGNPKFNVPISINAGRHIYDPSQGVTTKPHQYYHFFDDQFYQYKFPFRSFPYSKVRKVFLLKEKNGKFYQTEEAHYQGFDKVARCLKNHMFQGTTMDITKSITERMDLVHAKYGSRTIMPIHDELLFDVPTNNLSAFIFEAEDVLRAKPFPQWVVPITGSAKYGPSFGSMQPWQPHIEYHI